MTLMQMKQNEEVKFQLHQAAELGSLGHVLLTLEIRINKKGVVDSPVASVRNVPEWRPMERPLCEVVKVKTGLCWRLQMWDAC